MLPNVLVPLLRNQIHEIESVHNKDLNEGEGKTSLPAGLARKLPLCHH